MRRGLWSFRCKRLRLGLRSPLMLSLNEKCPCSSRWPTSSRLKAGRFSAAQTGTVRSPVFRQRYRSSQLVWAALLLPELARPPFNCSVEATCLHSMETNLSLRRPPRLGVLLRFRPSSFQSVGRHTSSPLPMQVALVGCLLRRRRNLCAGLQKRPPLPRLYLAYPSSKDSKTSSFRRLPHEYTAGKRQNPRRGKATPRATLHSPVGALCPPAAVQNPYLALWPSAAGGVPSAQAAEGEPWTISAGH
jgi:hypothetical protein